MFTDDIQCDQEMGPYVKNYGLGGGPETGGGREGQGVDPHGSSGGG